MTSYEYTLKGRALNQNLIKKLMRSIKMLDAAIEADDTNALPYSWKACTWSSYDTWFREEMMKTWKNF